MASNSSGIDWHNHGIAPLHYRCRVALETTPQRRPASYVGTELMGTPPTPSQDGLSASIRYTYRATTTGSPPAKIEATDRDARYAGETYRDSRRDSPTPTEVLRAPSVAGHTAPTTPQEMTDQAEITAKEGLEPTAEITNKHAPPTTPTTLTRSVQSKIDGHRVLTDGQKSWPIQQT